MVTSVVSVICNDGKLGEGIAWALGVASYINKQFPASEMEVVRNVGGPFYEIHMVSRCESLTVYDDLRKRSEADGGYQKLVGQAREQGLFIGSRITERLYETVS